MSQQSPYGNHSCQHCTPESDPAGSYLCCDEGQALSKHWPQGLCTAVLRPTSLPPRTILLKRDLSSKLHPHNPTVMATLLLLSFSSYCFLTNRL